MSTGEVVWFNLGTAEKLVQEPLAPAMKDIRGLLIGPVYKLFERHVQTAHLQFHHYCQPRQNESPQGKAQFDEKNSLTLEPVICELENLYNHVPPKIKTGGVYLHLADANLDELKYHRPDLLARLQKLAETGHVRFGGGILDEAFIGPDSVEFAVAAIISYFEKLIDLFGNTSLAPLVWIPERFFEEKTAAIIQKVYEHFPLIQYVPYLSIIVDENVIEHSLPRDWKGNIFNGWSCPQYPAVRIFVSSNSLRAMMPQSSPEEVNGYFFDVMNKTWSEVEKVIVNSFISGYQSLIERYANLCQTEDETAIHNLSLDANRFYLDATSNMSNIKPQFIFYVDDLEKNGSWRGTTASAFETKRHFFRYIDQASNLFNPYQMQPLERYKPDFKRIKHVKPSSYKEFSIIWNNSPLDVERWRKFTLLFLKAGLHSYEEIEAMSAGKVAELKLTGMEVEWYLDFVRRPVSWQDGQLSKYPEILLNYHLAHLVYDEIVKEDNGLYLHQALKDPQSAQGNLLHIWNKSRASCPNFIGFFGGASILFFRLHVSAQLAAVLSLKYSQIAHLEKEWVFEYAGVEYIWTLIKHGDVFKVVDDHGDTLFMFNQRNLHNLVNGYSRHREGYNSIIKSYLQGRTDSENFSLVDKSGGTTSRDPLVIALDLEGVKDLDIIRANYPEELNDFDNEEEIFNHFPFAWEQLLILPANAVDNPIVMVQESYFGDFKWQGSEKYFDTVDGRRLITFVRRGLFNQRAVDVIKKIDPSTQITRVEIWNRSNGPISITPTIVFPTSLDWYEGENYSINSEALPLRGDIKSYDQQKLFIQDKISNVKLSIESLRQDTQFHASTMYTYQTSDSGLYTVSPQHLLVVLGAKQSVTLQAGEGYIMDYHVNLENENDQFDWTFDWEKVPEELKRQIVVFSDLFFKDKDYTPFQMTKILYARFPEIIFWS